MISKQTRSKIRVIVGPPGTGKTHIRIKEEYSKLYDKYGPERGILLTHSNVARRELVDTIKSIEKVKNNNHIKEDEDYFKYKICTIHAYAKKNAGQRREVFDKKTDYENLCRAAPMLRQKHTASIIRDPVKYHPFFKCNAEAHGKGKNIHDHWRTAEDPHRSYEPFNLSMMLDIKQKYEKFKDDNHLQDYPDMLDSYNRKPEVPVVDFLIVDEAQDCSVPQMLAIDRMGEHAKEIILVGDPNQTIFQFAGANPDFFEKLFANVKEGDELKQGLRCSKAINTFAKKIIKPIWDHYGYERAWYPTAEEGSVQILPDLNLSKSLNNLMEKIKNSDESFLFTYRTEKSKQWIIPFFKKQGFKFRQVGSVYNHVSDKEFSAHVTWPDFLQGIPQSLEQIKHYWDHLDKSYKLKDARVFKKIINKNYNYQDLVKMGYLVEGLEKKTAFHRLVKVPKTEEKQEQLKERLQYITRVIAKGNVNQKSIVEYGNFHQVKGLTRDNVIVDRTITRHEPAFEQRRLGYTAVTRGKHEAWILKSQNGRELIL